MCAQWERHKSRSFHVCNGVKQGAVISPILFAVYYDELIAKLARSGYGCRISQHFVGALSYADDISLLSPSLQGLQYMVNICEEYGKEFHVKRKLQEWCLAQAMVIVKPFRSMETKLIG